VLIIMQKVISERVHTHQFDEGNPLAQKRILLATILTAVMMLLEVIGGWIFNSMALLADGWHMSSHMLALGLAYFAYRAARYYAHDSRFCFGTWKIEILAGYSSAILLIVVAIFMAIHSVKRLINPVQIYYDEAILIAILGLVINLICAWLLHNDEHHHHEHHHHEHSQDLNQKAAFLHVVADALTSVLAIIALIAGKYIGWDFLDALLGIVGAILVTKWACGLIKDTGKTLLDAEMNDPVVAEVYEVIEDSFINTVITDIHVWKVGTGKYACILALDTLEDLTAIQVRQALSIHDELVHVSVEINNKIDKFHVEHI
jgi:cation diffusion facilitator family transporter